MSQNPNLPTTLTLHCLCGASTHTLSLPPSSLPLPGTHCHCTSCRHSTGTLCLPALRLPPSTPIPRTYLSTLTHYAFSPRVSTYFCGACGTLIFWHRDGSENWYVAYAAVVEQRGLVKWERHLWLGDTGDGGAGAWLGNLGAVEQRRWRGEEEEVEGAVELPRGWEGDGGGEEGGREEVVRARCLCRGVEFVVTRPNGKSASPKLGGDPAQGGDPARPETWWLSPSKTHYLAGICVCDSCRLSASADLCAWAFIPTCNILVPPSESPTPDITTTTMESLKDYIPLTNYNIGTLTAYRSSPHATRYFCGTCGANVFYIADDRPQLLDVGVGLLEAKEGARAEEWLWWRTGRVSGKGNGEERGGYAGDLEGGLRAWGKAREKKGS